MVIQSSRRRLGGFVIALCGFWLLAGPMAAQHMNTCSMYERGSWQWYFFGCWLVGFIEAFVGFGSTPFIVR